MHKILEKMPLYTKYTQTLRDPCKILVHDIKNPFGYKFSINAQLLPFEWAVLYRESGDTLSPFFVKKEFRQLKKSYKYFYQSKLSKYMYR